MSNISSLAFVHPDAKLHPSVKVGPFAYIENDVEIGEGSIVDSNAVICEHTRIGKNCHIFPQATIGAVPQDLKFQGELTYTIIGDNNNIRECVTIHRGTASKGKTVVGNNNLIMAYCHVAHDVVLHDHIIMSNGVQLAGEVVVEDWAIISGFSLAHQFVHIGQHVMIQGGSHILKDVPPYIMAGKEPLAFYGLNSVGLNRRGFTAEQLATIKEVYKYIYLSHLNVTQAIEAVETNMPASPERDLILNFVKEGASRGIIRSGV